MTRDALIQAIQELKPVYKTQTFSGSTEKDLLALYSSLMLNKKLKRQSRKMQRMVRKIRKKQ